MHRPPRAFQMGPMFGRPVLSSLAIMLAFVLLPSFPAVALQAPNTSNPGEPHLVATGSAEPGDQLLSWRVEVATATADESGTPAPGPVGFAVADAADMTVELPDEEASPVELRAGEGTFLPAGPRRIVPREVPEATYHLISLEPAPDDDETSPPSFESDAELLLDSEPFPPLPGKRDIELWRATIIGSQTWSLPNSDAPIALLVTQGAVDMTAPDTTEPVTLVAGEAGIAPGEAVVEVRGRADAVIFAAVIGDRADGAAPSPTLPNVIPTQAGTGSAPSPTPTAIATTTVTPTPSPEPSPSPTSVALDSDGDGLSDNDEAARGTNPNSDDSDGDGVFDGYEVSVGLNPLLPDSDGDGVSDYDEVANETVDPGQGDSDGDGLKDGYEEQVSGTNPNNSDSDDDGLNDGEELSRGTNPLLDDTDDDGLLDGEEARLRTNPLADDTDGDFLWDIDEVRMGLNPLNPDTDGDGFTDGSETDTDPNNFDSDGDGLGDGEEVYRFGTSPIDRDTDNDCDDDGDEIANGTNPFQGVVTGVNYCLDP